MTETLDIMIPTMHPLREIREQVEAIEQTVKLPHRLIASCQPAYAAANRNFCLTHGRGGLVIMIDDDIEGFTDGWAARLIYPLINEARPQIVTARLMAPNGTVAPTCMGDNRLRPSVIALTRKPDHVMPSAAIAFRDRGIRFDEKFQGSGWEDNDFCFQHILRWPQVRFVVNNDCRLVHRNEAKSQGSPGHSTWEHNRKYFYLKWNLAQG